MVIPLWEPPASAKPPPSSAPPLPHRLHGRGHLVESGIPPFRGPGGLWDSYDPHTLELDYFLADPARAWPVIREIFYDNFGKARPNAAHEVLAAWEARGLLKCSSRRTSTTCTTWPAAGTSWSSTATRGARLPFLRDPRDASPGPERPSAAVPLRRHLQAGLHLLRRRDPAGGAHAVPRGRGATDVMLVVGSTGEVTRRHSCRAGHARPGRRSSRSTPIASEFTAVRHAHPHPHESRGRL